MKSLYISLLILVTLCATSFAQGYGELLIKADKTYESGDKETAKKLYLEAANLGSAEAHFALAYKYNLTDEENLHHYLEAARMGHSEALGYALDLLLFEAGSLKTANPQKALALYYEAKKANPHLKLYDEENKLKIMKMCVEPKGFDVENFMNKYGIEVDEDRYGVWELAEEASRGGRFGKPDPELVFNLVMRGGLVPAEFESAVEETYNNWKNGVVKPFNFCDYVTSGIGQALCASRENDDDEVKRDSKLKKLKAKLRGDASQLLDKAYSAMAEFIEAKAENEEGHGGTGRAAWVLESTMEQMNEYLELIEKTIGGFKPSPAYSLEIADQKLNNKYRELMEKTKKVAAGQIYWFATADNIRSVQRLWINYRDASAKLLSRIEPSVKENIWRSWFTERRIENLDSINQMIDDKLEETKESGE